MWVRGLKLQRHDKTLTFEESHPMWVRGLKHFLLCCARKSHFVAPYVGAWIETHQWQVMVYKLESHPMWVRGLKQPA